MKAAPIIVGVVGLAAGLGAGRFLARDVSLAEAVHETRPVESDGARATPPPSHAAEEKHDLATLMARLRRPDSRTAPEMQAQLETMSEEALVKLLAELCSREGEDRKEFSANESVRSAVARELFRRKGMGAIEEVEKEPDANLRFMMTAAFMEIAAKESPMAAKEWMDRRRKEYGIEDSFFGDRSLIQGATLAGAETLIALHERYGRKWEKERQDFPGPEFPPDFDFSLLVKHFPLDKNHGMKRAMMHWGARDKEAAMTAIRGNIEQDGPKAAGNFGAVVTGVAITEGNEKAAEWMAKQLDTLPDDARKAALASFSRRVLDMQMQNMNEATVVVLASKLPRAEDRVTFVGSSLTDMGEPESNLRILEALPSAVEREEALIKALPGLQGYGDEQLREMIDLFATKQNLPDTDRARLMEEIEVAKTKPLPRR